MTKTKPETMTDRDALALIAIAKMILVRVAVNPHDPEDHYVAEVSKSEARGLILGRYGKVDGSEVVARWRTGSNVLVIG